MSERALLDAALVRRRRPEMGLSVRTVSGELGVTATMYTALENGHGHDVVTLDTVLRLARVLGTTVEALLVDEVEEPNAVDEEDDPARLGAVLVAVGKLTPVGTLIEVLDWPLDPIAPS